LRNAEHKSWGEVSINFGALIRAQVGLLAKVLRADIGSSMSMSMRSWLKRFNVTPVSTVEKNDMGDLIRVSSKPFPIAH